MRNLLVFVFVFIFQIFFSQYKIYVSTKGDDHNNGTERSPVYSLQTAFDLAKKENARPVEIKVGGGNYFFETPLVINESYSRKSDTKLKVSGEIGNKPVFYGGNKITPIVDEQGNWIINTKNEKNRNSKSDLPSNILTINGQSRKAGQFPFTGLLKTQKVFYDDNGFTVQIPSELNRILNTYNDKNIKNITATFYVKWTAIIRYIDKHDFKNSTLSFKGKKLPDLYLIEPNKTQFKLNNIKYKLNPGEWYYKDANVIVYKPLKTDNIKTSIVVVPDTSEIIRIIGSPGNKISYLEFENISFSTVGSGLNKSGYFPYQAAADVESVINMVNATKINFNSISFSNINSNVLWIKEGCNHIGVLNCDFSDLGAGAIKIGTPDLVSDITNNIIVDHNIIKNGGKFYPDAVSVLILNAHDNIVSHNDISKFEYSAISIGWVWGYAKSLAYKNTISYNHIYNIGTGLLDDMGGIYTLGVSDGTSIENNVIHNVLANSYGGWGIYLDEGSSNIAVKNNLVYNCSGAGFHQHYGRENTVENNIFAFNKELELQASRIENHLSLTFMNNIVVHHTKLFFNEAWSELNKNASDNTYFSLDSNKKNFSGFIKNEKSFHYINPLLEKKDFYYEPKNNHVYKITGFNRIDFSKVGAYK
ncbi:right-handed parallel beta-helix repeat-containing protein [uncultured Chryseobacterium sp.]|uniref:right-handed parallel beta-helix repeat-containing protein n=1 Tax=uncultured Chryseobacterium sp. TaxID=259322 RepID=UPI0025D70AFC|nr:right-handed parallel beta-helix repeat-containing protein [uncultured Chryseobacterium sp.]